MAYYISDQIGIGRFEYYLGEEPSGKFYHKEIQCSKCTKDPCEVCIKRETKLNKYVLSPNNVLKVSLNGIAASHHNLFHRRIGEPIPPWSHAEGGDWDKEMEKKGYSKEMVKFIPDTKVLEFVSNLKGTIPQKTKQILEQYPTMIKAEALRYIKTLNKPVEKTFIVDPSLKEEAFDLVEVHVRKINICGKEYLYDQNKGKVYSLDYVYVGRYNKSEKLLDNSYPDSDAEPIL